MSEAKLTDEQRALRFVTTKGLLCPVCGGSYPGHTQQALINEDGTASAGAWCQACDAAWVNVYSLVGIKGIYKGEYEEDPMNVLLVTSKALLDIADEGRGADCEQVDNLRAAISWAENKAGKGVPS